MLTGIAKTGTLLVVLVVPILAHSLLRQSDSRELKQTSANELAASWRKSKFSMTLTGQFTNSEGMLTGAHGNGELFLCENTFLIHSFLHPEEGRIFLFELTGSWNIVSKTDGKLEIVLNCPDPESPDGRSKYLFTGQIGMNNEFRSLGATISDRPMIIGNVNLIDDDYRFCRRYIP